MTGRKVAISEFGAGMGPPVTPTLPYIQWADLFEIKSN